MSNHKIQPRTFTTSDFEICLKFSKFAILENWPTLTLLLLVCQGRVKDLT